MEDDQEKSTSAHSKMLGDSHPHISQDSPQQRAIDIENLRKNCSLWQKYKQLEQQKEREDKIEATKLLRKKLSRNPVNSIEHSFDSVYNEIKLHGPGQNYEMHGPSSTANSTPDKDNRNLEAPIPGAAVNFTKDNGNLEMPGACSMAYFTSDSRNLEMPKQSSTNNLGYENQMELVKQTTDVIEPSVDSENRVNTQDGDQGSI